MDGVMVAFEVYLYLCCFLYTFMVWKMHSRDRNNFNLSASHHIFIYTTHPQPSRFPTISIKHSSDEILVIIILFGG